MCWSSVLGVVISGVLALSAWAVLWRFADQRGGPNYKLCCSTAIFFQMPAESAHNLAKTFKSSQIPPQTPSKPSPTFSLEKIDIFGISTNPILTKNCEKAPKIWMFFGTSILDGFSEDFGRVWGGQSFRFLNFLPYLSDVFFDMLFRRSKIPF